MLKYLDTPPVWLFGFAVIAYWQAEAFSMGLSLSHPVTHLLAGLLIGAGILLILLAALEFRRHKTTIIPHQEAEHLIQIRHFQAQPQSHLPRGCPDPDRSRAALGCGSVAGAGSHSFLGA